MCAGIYYDSGFVYLIFIIGVQNNNNTTLVLLMS